MSANSPVTSEVSREEALELGAEAYTYLYPLLTMEATRRQMTNAEAGGKIGFGPMNTFIHTREFPPADFRAVVRPNFDTLYSLAWLDLSDEPLVLSVPDSDGRYYLLPMLDMWTDVFAVPGKRTSGTGPGHYAIAPPGWQGSVPDEVELIHAPTPYVWTIGRTQTNGPSDYGAVHSMQDGFEVVALSRFGGEPAPVQVEIDPTVDMETAPLEQVNALSAADYFSQAAELMKVHPPHITDWSTVTRLRRIGLRAGESFDFDALAPDVQEALNEVPAKALGEMQAKLPTLASVVNGWQMNVDTMGVYGNFYLKRAIVTLLGLGANPAEDATYPICLTDGDGQALDGANDYVLRFGPEELPPVEAFWSVTMYDEEGFQVSNDLNRFALGDRDELVYGDDGSLELYMQHESPGPDKEKNWLPAPRGPLGVTMRLYAPKPQVLEGSWAPPAVERA
ncbi:MAG TPA: DUF1254 domain-containing protein [Thermoleophilaceae bacterium]|nr:DUF1254 domain-containing protein [Thermoleophilaceae bacterium]